MSLCVDNGGSVSLPDSKIRLEFFQRSTPQLTAAVKQLLVPNLWNRSWSRDVAEKIVEWRYSELAGYEVILAFEGDRPIAMVAAHARPCILNGASRYIREPSDWFCLPEYRRFGLGVWLISEFMSRPEPLIAIGGTEDAGPVLPTLGWRRLPDVKTYALVLTSRALLNKVFGVSHFRKSPNAARGLRLWSRLHSMLYPKRNRSESSHELGSPEAIPNLRPECNVYGLQPLMRDREVRWLYAAPPEMGKFFCLIVTQSNQAIGSCIGRVYWHENLKYAKLVHIEATNPSTDIYGRVLAETIRYVNAWGADVVQCRASCPLLRHALTRLAFVPLRKIHSYWWSKNATLPAGMVHLTFMRGDDGIRPYPY